MDRELGAGVRSALASFLLWGGLTAYWKLLSDLPAVELVGWRVAMACVALWAVQLMRRRRHVMVATLRDPGVRRHLAIAAVLLAVNWSTYVIAVTGGRVLETALGYFLSPLLTVAIGVVALGEHLDAARRAAILLAGTAIIIMTVSYGRLPWVAVLLAGSWSFYGWVKRRVPLNPVESLTGEVTILAPVALAVVAVGSVHGGDGVITIADEVTWPLVIGTGVITAVPLLLFAHAAQRVPFTLLGPLGWLIPIINFGLGWIAYNEDLPPARMVGFAMVWIALIIVAIAQARPANTTPT